MGENKIINISKKTFINVLIILFSLIVVSTVFTYLIPKGEFAKVNNHDGSTSIDYSNFIYIDGAKGINIFKGLFSPILVLGSSDGLTIIMLSLFLLSISGSFQIINDINGIKSLVRTLIAKVKDKKKILIATVVLIFMMFGAFLGLFEEVLTLLPLIIVLTISLGYDSFTAFIICIVATGFGFASAITNPFTVLAASEIIGVSPLSGIWYRLLVFAIMYAFILLYTFHHIRKIEKNPKKSPTYEIDLQKRDSIVDDSVIENERKVFNTSLIFFITFLVTIITSTIIPFLRGYTVVILIVILLVGGFVSGKICEKDFKKVLKSFKTGVVAALPAVALVLLASSIKYILEEGQVISTIAFSISQMIKGRDIFVVAILLYFIIIALEFFISSSTAKAIIVMGILSYISIDLSKETLVLIYLFGDGYTNVFFPTSPVLLIGLSMIGMNYTSWIKKSFVVFIINTILVIGLICLAVLIGY